MIKQITVIERIYLHKTGFRVDTVKIYVRPSTLIICHATHYVLE